MFFYTFVKKCKLKVYSFNKEKYNNGLLIEAGKIEELPFFDFSDNLHCSDFFVVLIFSKIKGNIILDTQKIDIQNEQLLFISPYQKRQWTLKSSDVFGYYLVFEKEFLNTFFADKFFVYRLQYFFNPNIKCTLKYKSGEFSSNENFFQEIMKEIIRPKKDSEHLLRSILYYILTKLNRDFCQFHNIDLDAQFNQTLIEFKKKLEENYNKYHKVKDYAEMLNITGVTLNKLTKKYYNISARDIIKEKIVNEIKSKLLYTNKTVSEIAYDLNFNELHHLTRLFKKHTGITPKNFRENH